MAFCRKKNIRHGIATLVCIGIFGCDPVQYIHDPANVGSGALSTSTTVTKIKFRRKPVNKSVLSPSIKGTVVSSIILNILEIQFLRNSDPSFSFSPATPQIDILAQERQLSSILGNTQVPAGTYDHIRLILGENNWIVIDGKNYSLKVPSGQQSGLKLKYKSDIIVRGGRISDLQLVFDLGHSISGSLKGQINFKPVVEIGSIASFTPEQDLKLQELGAEADELIERADIIVQTTVQQQTQSVGTYLDNPMIFTNVDLSVNDQIKGSSDTTLRLEVLGGVMGDVRIGATHVVHFADNESSILFLKQYSNGLGTVSTSNGVPGHVGL